MSVKQFNATFNRTTPPSPEAALPVVTFTDVITFHWNGDEIRVYHVPPAHTDTDSSKTNRTQKKKKLFFFKIK